MARILVIDSKSAWRSALKDHLEGRGHSVKEAADGKRAVASACGDAFDLIILSVDIPRPGGYTTFKTIRDERPELTFIVTAEADSLEPAVWAVESGAYLLLAKPFALEEIDTAVDRAIERSRLIEQNNCLLGEMRNGYVLSSALAKNPGARSAYALAAKAAKTDVPVLIVGESGSGKEYLARAIHYQSNRGCGPFVKINCSRPETALDIRLFGSEKLAKANGQSVGVLECARGGTVFLDEVAYAGISVQSKLLRLLEEKWFERIGGADALFPDVRIVAASSQDLASSVERRQFCPNLYERLSRIMIKIPPLRDRKEDVAPLAMHFLQKYAAETGRPIASIEEPALAQLVSYHWKGNVRELENCIERCVIHCSGESIRPADLAVNGAASAARRTSQSPMKSLREVERDHIKRVLVQCKWNRSAAAETLDIDRKTLRSKMREFGFIPPDESQ
ncbi:MAG: sigma-54-dependent Fis family transcriptional regulator [Armatimonadetes bacterium]|nr:sigma-54-dependent Fis family transcriptional regulator [Armatimonadota bacterium]